MSDKIYTTGEVAKILGVHKNTIFYWLRTGKVKEPKRDSLFNGRIWTQEELGQLKKARMRKTMVLKCPFPQQTKTLSND